MVGDKLPEAYTYTPSTNFVCISTINNVASVVSGHRCEIYYFPTILLPVCLVKRARIGVLTIGYHVYCIAYLQSKARIQQVVFANNLCKAKPSSVFEQAKISLENRSQKYSAI